MADRVIRTATADDVHTWRALRLEGVLAHSEAFIISADAARAMPLEKDMEAFSRTPRWLAWQGDTAMGFVGLHPNTTERARHRAEIGPLYVTPTARGQGVAEALIRHAMASGREPGIWQFELFVNDQNAAAIRLYTRLGFGEVGAVPNAILGAHGPERDILMIRTEGGSHQ